MIVSPEHIYLEQSSLQYAFRYDDMEWQDWESLMKESYAKYIFPARMTRQNALSQEMLLYVQSMVTYSGVKGTFIFPIKTEAIKELMRDAYISNEGWAYMLDQDGQVLLTIPSGNGEFVQVEQELLEGKDMILRLPVEGRNVRVIRTVSEKTGISFVTVLPDTYITEQIRQARRLLLLLMALATAAGIVSIMSVSWYRGKKIVNILDMLFQLEVPKDRPEGDEMTYISNSLKRLIEKNKDLKDNILKQQPITRGLLLEGLLRGTGEASQKNLKEYGIDLEGKKVAVLMFQFRGGKDSGDIELNAGETAIFKQVLHKALDALFAGEKYMCDTDISDGAFICTLEEEGHPPREELCARLNELCDTFWEEYGVSLRLALGNVCERLEDISKSYDQTCEMLGYGDNTGRNVLFYEDYMDSRDYYYFPVPLEERLVNAVLTGNMEGMHEQLKAVYQVNVLEWNLSPSMMYFLVNDLQCAVFKALHGLDRNVEFEEKEIYCRLEQVNRENDILLRFNRINGIFMYICEKVKQKNEASTHLLRQQIEAYIMENYGRNDMSLSVIAEDFGYASTYFSKLFKELFAENFTAYLEKVRIEQVCIRIKEGETLEKIAEQTGYNSVYVMRTAFKRIKGMTPNEFRKMSGGKREE